MIVDTTEVYTVLTINMLKQETDTEIRPDIYHNTSLHPGKVHHIYCLR